MGWLLDEEGGSRVNSGATVPSVTVEGWEFGGKVESPSAVWLASESGRQVLAEDLRDLGGIESSILAGIVQVEGVGRKKFVGKVERDFISQPAVVCVHRPGCDVI